MSSKSSVDGVFIDNYDRNEKLMYLNYRIGLLRYGRFKFNKAIVSGYFWL
jgi:hypothetical protein